MDHRFSKIDHVTPLFKFFLVVHLQTHSAVGTQTGLSISSYPIVLTLQNNMILHFVKDLTYLSINVIKCSHIKKVGVFPPHEFPSSRNLIK